MVEYKAREKSLDLVKVIDPSFPETIIIDGLRLKQVLLNLLTNAIKFTASGSVTVTINQQWKAAKQKKLMLHVSVKDTGIGIKKSHQKIIFDAFSQADMSITRKFGGTGLGLAICKQLLKKMGSTLHLSSKLGEGSNFYFDLVVDYDDTSLSEVNKETESLPVNKQTPDSDFSGKKILIAEDDPINRKLARTALKRFSKHLIIIEAENGKEACQSHQNQRPDLIFMDIVMPEMDGYQAAQQIRQSDKQTPIIAMTAKALKEDRDICLNAGMNDLITKPFSLDRLKDMLKKYLPVR